MPKKSPAPPTIERIAQLQQLVADFAKVLRLPNLADINRRENDVEHSYGLALTCWFLAPKLAPELNLEKIFCYALAHDLVEIYAGDTNPFGLHEHIQTKLQREAVAAKRLKKEWPDFKDLDQYIEGYAAKRDQEAVFVYGVDKLLPPIMVNLGEKDKHWNKHKITLQMHTAEKEAKMSQSKYIWPYHERLIEWLTSPDYFYKPKAK